MARNFTKHFIWVRTENYTFRASVVFYMDGKPQFYCNAAEVGNICEGLGFDICRRAVEEREARMSFGISVFTGAVLFGAKGAAVVDLNN